MEKRNKIIYWVSTGLLCALMCMSAGMYFFNNEMISTVFTDLGYPTYLIYPIAVAKILAVTAILTKRSKMLKEWAYAGLFFDFVLALSAHLHVSDGNFGGALFALAALSVSYLYDKRVFQ